MALRANLKNYLPGDPELHSIYGVNCFLHALGYSYPFMNVMLWGKDNNKPGVDLVDYIYTGPGNSALLLDNPSLSAKQSLSILFTELAREKLEPTDSPTQRPGHRILALFFNESIRDYHFAYIDKRGKIESKVPFDVMRTFTSIPDVEAFENTKFKGYFLATENHEPSSLKRCTLSLLKDGKGRHIGLIKGLHSYAGRRFLFDTNVKEAFCLNSGSLVPLPSWPLEIS